MRGAVGTAVSVTAALASGTPAPAASAGSSYPNIVFILVDDLGESGVAFNNPHVLGPRVRELREEGLLLSRHYVYKYCSPTRGSMLTGRYPWRLGSMRSNFIPWSRPDGLRPDFDLLPQRLGGGRRVEHRRRPRRRRADRRHDRRDGQLLRHRELRRHAPRRGGQLRRLRGENWRRRQRVSVRDARSGRMPPSALCTAVLYYSFNLIILTLCQCQEGTIVQSCVQLMLRVLCRCAITAITTRATRIHVLMLCALPSQPCKWIVRIFVSCWSRSSRVGEAQGNRGRGRGTLSLQRLHRRWELRGRRCRRKRLRHGRRETIK